MNTSVNSIHVRINHIEPTWDDLDIGGGGGGGLCDPTVYLDNYATFRYEKLHTNQQNCFLSRFEIRCATALKIIIDYNMTIS